ncbi:glycoprotein IX (platelet) isoform X2 [Osmerus eperlanus]|uniref:glycoprotein IX (platelet) isoform X2 n=1 Tax=Osmerus eperlanus TaxID=29151 RepID=UPI002E12C096
MDACECLKKTRRIAQIDLWTGDLQKKGLQRWLDTESMLLGSCIVILLLLDTSSAQTVPKPCHCSAQVSGLQVNCSSLGLIEVPPLPTDTTELHLQDNQFTTVPPGHFDRLPLLRRVTLSGNPFHCDCGIQYLRVWLQRNRAAVFRVPTCVSPRAVAHTAITALSDAHFSSCGQQRCTGGLYNSLVGVMLCGLIALLLWGLRLAKHSTFTLEIDEPHAGFEAHSLHSHRPKHRRRRRSMLSESSGTSVNITCIDDLERARINMELLPQIMNSLHENNIKIKAT